MRALLRKKKFHVAMASIITIVAAHFGLAVPPETTLLIVSPLLLLLGGIALEDLGKAGKQIEADKEKE